MRARAFFGPPVAQPVPGGLHVGAAVIPVERGRLWLLYRREGIFGGPENAWYFPTDYFHYAEPIKKCVHRVVSEQAGLKVRAFAVADAWSFVPGPDSDWHLGLWAVAEVAGRPRAGPGVEEVGAFKFSELKRQRLAWYTMRQLRQIFQSPVIRRLKVI